MGGMLASFAGSFYAHYVTLVSPEIMSFPQMVTMLLMLVIGGRGTVAGPVIGAILFTIIPEYLRMAKAFKWPIYGVLLIFAILIIPQGIMPALRSLWIQYGLYFRFLKIRSKVNAHP
jgi:branched-chain amino acid transport system permease protein